MRRPAVIWLLLAGATLALAIFAVPGRRVQPPTLSSARPSTAPAVSELSPPPEKRPAFAATAADYEADAPRRRNNLGQPLPFREKSADGAALSQLRDAQPGALVTLALFPELEVNARVSGRWNDATGRRVAAQVEGSPPGDRLFISWDENGARGLVELPSRNLAYEILPAPGGGTSVREWLLTDVVCAHPRSDDDAANRGIPRPPERTTRSPVARITAGEVPLLNSRPGASGVIYLDFDGETVSGSSWAGGATIVAPAARMNASQVREAWERVARDFENFTLNVTTDLAVFNAAPLNRRIRCVITSNDAAAPGAGGVAYVGSFTSTDQALKVCWSFVDLNAKDCAEVTSHEVGHTLGLNHDGRIAANGFPRDEYYEGHGSGPTGWAPIMGVGYDRQLVQWSRGEYARANNPEDDLAILSEATRGPYPADDHGSSIAQATAVTGDRIDGLIERNTDTDFYSISLTPGTYALNLQPSAYSNLKSELQVLRADGGQIALGSQVGALSATASFTLAATTTVYLRVRGIGEGLVSGTGFSSYGSLGTYHVTGFGNQEQPPSAPIGLGTTRVSGTQLRVNWTLNPSALSYQVYRNGVLVGTVTSGEFLDTSVQPATEYTYAVVAVNQYGSSPASSPTVVTSPAADEFIMDGAPDFDGYLVSNPGMTIYAALRGTKLYLATWSPGDNGSGLGSDHHVFVSDTLLGAATTPAPWAKRGQISIPGGKPYFAGESTTTFAGWFNTAGPKSLFKSPLNTGVLEGVIDLAAEFGTMPQNVYVAAVAYQTEDQSGTNSSSGRINGQAPAGNGNDDLEPGELLRIPVRQVADAKQNGIYDSLDAARTFRPSALTFTAQGFPIVSWPAVPGKTYRVFQRTALDSGVWTQVHSRTAGAAEWELSFTNPVAGATNGYFRVSQP